MHVKITILVLIVLMLVPLVSFSQDYYDSLKGKQVLLPLRTWSSGTFFIKGSKDYDYKRLWQLDTIRWLNYEKGFSENTYVIFKSTDGDSLAFTQRDFSKLMNSYMPYVTVKQRDSLIKKYTNYTFRDLMIGMFWIGMSYDQLIISRGLPDAINTTKTKISKSQQLVYRFPETMRTLYIYIQNNKVTSFQN